MQDSGRYTHTAILLHWLIAVLIIGNVALILVVDWFPDSLVRPVIDTHKSVGITVLGLALLRILWRVSHRPPALPASYRWLERAAAHAVHLGLYGLIIALPVSGWIHDSAFKDAATTPLRLFGLVPGPRIGPIMAMAPVAKEQLHTVWFEVHATLAYVLYVLLALHVLGALKHQVFDKESALGRMLPWGGSGRLHQGK
jgi:cytochrome b561